MNKQIQIINNSRIQIGVLVGGLLLWLAACVSEKEPLEKKEQWPQGVTYEIFVQSFADSNGDGIGDFNGMTKKLPYLDSLGVEAVWLMPIMPSPSYHKYDVTDYYNVHPDYGTMEDFIRFVNKAHERNIKVVIDLVINHSSVQHPWFQEASKGIENPYRSYYVWAKKDSIVSEIAKKEITMDSDNIRQWHPVKGDTIAEHYYGFFNKAMPDLNFDSPALREEVYAIGTFWLREVGVDGFRLDAAKHIFPEDRANDNHAFWEEFLTEMQKINPQVYTVGEVWANTETVAPYAKGFSALFNFDLAFSILASVKNETASAVEIDGPTWKPIPGKTLIDGYLESRAVYKEVNPAFFNANFLSNHDQNRAMTVLEGDLNKAMLAASILMTLPGQPYLYYGEEIGMKGRKPDEQIREPMLWETRAKENTSWIIPEYSTPETVKTVAEQWTNPNSLLRHYQSLIELRRSNSILAHGTIAPIATGTTSTIAYTRTYQGKSLLVLHNLTGKREAIPSSITSAYNHLYYTTIKGSSVESLAPYATILLSE